MNRGSKLSVCLLLMTFLVSACGSPTPDAPTATLAPTLDSGATATAESNQQATSVAATLTAFPTPTALPSATATLEPTATEVPPTATSAPTDTPAPTATQVPTQRVVNTAPPPTATAAPVSDSIYSWTGGGPAGYTSLLFCSRADGSSCEATMPTGDIVFSILLQSSADAVEVIFYPFGLSIEKDGVNMADMYITADAGWLPPDSVAQFGVSRNFTQPGRYVVRTNGCLFTRENWITRQCNWWTLDGTVVTFNIQ